MTASATPQPTRTQQRPGQIVNFNTADPRYRQRIEQHQPYASARPAIDPLSERHDDRDECYEFLRQFFAKYFGHTIDPYEAESNLDILAALIRVVDERNPRTLQSPTEFYHFLTMIQMPKGVTMQAAWKAKQPLSKQNSLSRHAAIAWLVSLYDNVILKNMDMVPSNFWDPIYRDHKRRKSVAGTQQNKDLIILETLGKQNPSADLTYSIQDINIPIAAYSRLKGDQQTMNQFKTAISSFVNLVLNHRLDRTSQSVDEISSRLASIKNDCKKIGDFQKETKRQESNLKQIMDDEHAIQNSLNQLKRSIEQSCNSAATIEAKTDSEKHKLAELQAEIDLIQTRIESQQMSLQEAEQYKTEIVESQRKCEALRANSKEFKTDKESLERQFKQDWKKPSAGWKLFISWLSRRYSSENPIPEVLSKPLNIDKNASRSFKECISTVFSRTSIEEVVRNIKVHSARETRSKLSITNVVRNPPSRPLPMQFVLNFDAMVRGLLTIADQAKQDQIKVENDSANCREELETLRQENAIHRTQIAKLKEDAEAKYTSLTNQLTRAINDLQDRRLKSQSRLNAAKNELEKLCALQSNLKNDIIGQTVLLNQGQKIVIDYMESKCAAVTERSYLLKNQELPKAIEWIANLRDIQVNLLRQQVDHLPEIVRKAVIENPEVCELLGYDPPNVVEETDENQSSCPREEFDYSDIEEAPAIANPENAGVQKRNILGVLKHRENFSSKV